LIKNLDSSSKLSRAIDGTMYLPGIVGLNNIKENDYCNVILQVSSSWLNFCRKLIDLISGIEPRVSFERLLLRRKELSEHKTTSWR